MKPIWKAVIIPICLCTAPAAFARDLFNVDEMPVGAEVTLPGAAKTLVPMSTRIRFASTDSPQTISIVPIILSGGRPAPVRVAIFDTKQDRVKYIQIAPGAPFLYSFKGLSSITVQTEVPATAATSKESVRLQVESDKPLTVAR